MTKQRAVFLDRDGTLNALVKRDGVYTSPLFATQFRLLPNVGMSVTQLRDMGFLVFVISNQPDIARGNLSIYELEKMTTVLQNTLRVNDIMVCPHDDRDTCICRKPKPGMLTDLAMRWGIDLSASYMIGDSWRDMMAGRAAGCKTIYIDPLNELQCMPNPNVDIIATSLPEAVARIAFSSKFMSAAAAIIAQTDYFVLDQMARAIVTIRNRGGRLFFLGVGGGAGHASHAVNDFRKLAGIECYTPTDNVSELTARINDDGWNESFAEWLRGSRLNANDGVFVFSVGGGDEVNQISVNIINAVNLAKKVGAMVLGIVGRDGGHTAKHGDVVMVVPIVESTLITPLTEAFQAMFWHLLVSHPMVAMKQAKWESMVETNI